MKSNLDVLREMIQTADVDTIIEFFGGDTAENVLCALVTGDHIRCRFHTHVPCKDCIRNYLLSQAEVNND